MDEEGHFHVQGVGPALVAVAASARGDSTTRKTSVRPGGPLELFFFSGSSAVGTDNGPNYTPVEGASVQLESRYRTYYRFPDAAQRTNASGLFSIFGTEPGKYRLVVRHKDM